MPNDIHGTRSDPTRQHPVLDIEYWSAGIGEIEKRYGGGWIDCPRGLAALERARSLARAHGDLGPSVPADLFVWADNCDHDRPWLTRIGGKPWRESGKPWPRDDKGIPLTFLGQICFVDSGDIVPFKPPDDVLLIFGTYNEGYVGVADGAAIEWSPLKIERPQTGLEIPRFGTMPFELQGVIHRTVQYTDVHAADEPFKAVGFLKGAFMRSSAQATSVSAYAGLPQGWPFEKSDGNSLLCTLSSFYFSGEWPLCDVPTAPKSIRENGREDKMWNEPLRFSVGDAGCIYVARDRNGKFFWDDPCG